jgi:hypothetical protein
MFAIGIGSGVDIVVFAGPEFGWNDDILSGYLWGLKVFTEGSFGLAWLIEFSGIEEVDTFLDASLNKGLVDQLIFRFVVNHVAWW